MNKKKIREEKKEMAEYQYNEQNQSQGNNGLCIAGFVVSLVSIKFLMSFVKRHSFAPFGIYRIILGVGVLTYFLVSR